MVKIISCLFTFWGLIALYAALFLTSTFWGGFLFTGLGAVLIILAVVLWVWDNRHKDYLYANRQYLAQANPDAQGDVAGMGNWG